MCVLRTENLDLDILGLHSFMNCELIFALLLLCKFPVLLYYGNGVFMYLYFLLFFAFSFHIYYY